MQKAEQAAILSSVGAIDLKHIGAGVHVLEVAQGRVPDVVRLLKSRNEVRYAEPDYIQSLAAGSLPNDASVVNQWAVQNTGQSVNNTTGTASADEHSSAAWSVTTGTNTVVVAVLDSGVQYSHPDLVTNMWNNPGGIAGCAAGTHGYNILAANCDPMDDDATYGGHGTHVAGILGALGNNAAGIAGVNWTTSIMAVKWVNSTDVGDTSDLIAGMDWVLRAKQAGVNVRVVNDSATWAGTAISQALSDEIDLLGANDILFVAASGNTAQNNDQLPNYPCSYNRPTMICVAASDQNDNLWSASNFGPESVQLAAPGSNIYSTLRSSNYGYLSGGSMAAPQVAGTAALILSLGYQPVNSLRSAILNNVDVLSSLSGNVGTGGRLNVCKAVPGCAAAVSAIPANLALPVVTSIPQQGSLLGASTGAWSGLPTSYSYQWNRCNSSGFNCSSIPGATGQAYALLAAADIQATLSVTVTAANSLSITASQSSASSLVVPATSAFAITSSISNGFTISGTPQWKATPANAVNFVQFYVDGVLVYTAAASPYLFSSGGALTLDTSTLSNGSHVLGLRALAIDNRTYVFSSANVTVSNAPRNISLPAIAGTASVGQTLSTSNGAWTSNPTSFTYGWQRCDSGGLNCAVITGATSSTYTISASDSGLTIRSSVTAVNSVGSTIAVSAQTPAAAPAGKSQALALQGAAVMGQLQTSGASTPGSGGSSVAVTLAATTAGDLLLVGINSDASTLTSVTDNKSNPFTAASKVVSGGEIYAIYYAKNILAGATTVTVKTSFGDTDVIVAEYQGMDTAAPFDQTAFFDNGYNGGASFTSHAAPQTTAASELLWGFAGDKYGNKPVWASATGWTARRTQVSSFAQDQIVSAQGQFTSSGTMNATNGYEIGAMIATFKFNGAPPPPPPAISSFTAAPASITSGQSSLLSWTVSGATSLSISGIGTVTGTSTNVSPTLTTTYTLTATNSGGSTTAQTTVTVTPDTTLPTVSITAPVAGATISGTVSLTASASDNVGVASVQFQLGGSNLGSAITTAPYTSTWNTTTVANGPYTLTAIAKDLSNNSATSAPISVTVNNPVPTISSFTANPSAITAGQSAILSWSVSGSTSLSISGIGTVTGTSTTVSPALTTSYTLTATNAAGSSTAQATVTVTADTTAPSVSIVTPAAGATVSGTVSITATASDNVSVANVQYQLGGTNLSGVLSTTPYTFSWNTTTLANGPFTLTAIAKDAANNTGTSVPVAVTVNNPAPVISSFTASPATILAGGSTTLSWSVTNATSLSISGIGTVTGTSKSVSPTQTTTYTLTATNISGSSTAQTTVTISTATASITHIQTTGASTSASGASSLSVTINPTQAGSLLIVGINTDGSTITSVTDNKSDVFIAASNKVVGGSTFAVFYAKNVAAGVTSVSSSFPFGGADLVVAEYQGLDPVAPLDKTSFLDDGYSGGSAYTSGPTAQTSSVLELLWGFAGDKYGNTPVWTPAAGWTARRTQHSSFAQEEIVSVQGQFASSGTMNASSGYEIGATIATFAASGVASPPPLPTISSFTATPATISSGQSAQLSWSVSNAASLSISGIGTVTGTSTSVSPTQTITYTLTATNTSGSATAQTTVTVSGSGGTGSGVNIIIDSDLADDADDVGDHALMWTLAKQGKLNVLALITSSTNDYSAPAAYAIAKYYGHPNIPIGAYHGSVPNNFSYTFSYYAQTLGAQFGKGSSDTRANYPDAVTVYRQALVSAPNASVYIVAGGFFQPLVALLQSGPDSISPLTGAQLVAQKVAALVPVAGFFPNSSGSASNFTGDPDGASYVFANWTAPIISVGNEVGQSTLTGPAANANPATNPVKDAYNLFCTNGQFCPNMTPGWTQTAILFVANGLGSNFVYGGQDGTTVVSGSSSSSPGSNTWSQSPNSHHSYIEKTISDSSMSSILNALIQAGP